MPGTEMFEGILILVLRFEILIGSMEPIGRPGIVNIGKVLQFIFEVRAPKA